MLFLLIANLTRGFKDLNNLTKDGHDAKWMSSFVNIKTYEKCFYKVYLRFMLLYDLPSDLYAKECPLGGAILLLVCHPSFAYKPHPCDSTKEGENSS
jgi:hypothetical protein